MRTATKSTAPVDDPAVTAGNIENFAGVAQVPIGIAGPLPINGEHAVGDFVVPMATTGGTLVASYNRGMRLLTECGGVRTTVVEESMQRAPALIFGDARAAREFGHWLQQHFAAIKMLGCYGQDKGPQVRRDLRGGGAGGAVIHDDWVSSHDRLGRNRP